MPATLEPPVPQMKRRPLPAENVQQWALVCTVDCYTVHPMLTDSVKLFDTPDDAYAFAAELLVRHGHAVGFETGYALGIQTCDTAEELIFAFQERRLSAREYFNVMPVIQ